MKKNNRPCSSVMDIKGWYRFIRDIARQFSYDGVTVYAAQAAFYTITASIPFLMLLLTFSKYIVPEAVNALFQTIKQIIPDRFSELFTAIYKEVTGRTDIPLISATALTVLWSSSRAVSAVIKGVASIYDAENTPGLIKNLFYSFTYTIIFVVLITGALLVLVFGVTIKNIVTYRFPGLGNVFSIILSFRGLFFFIVLTLFFSLIYYAVSKNIIKSSGTLRKYTSQFPGAILASAGWMLFSYFYSLYMKYYPTSSYIYGSLTAVMLMMFWVYFCMIILLAGAEINKLLNK